MKTPDINAPRGFDITPKLAVKNKIKYFLKKILDIGIF